MSRAQLTSTVEQSSGGVVAPFLAGKNKIINGDMSVWQRGTSITPASGYGYGADRWRTYSFSASSHTISQQAFTAGTAPVAGYESTYFLRNTPTGAVAAYLSQPIEDVRTFAGQTVTLSFWYKVQSAQTISTSLVQNFGSSGSTSVSTSSTSSVNGSGTTSWQRYTSLFTLPSISGKTIGSSNFLEVLITGANTTNYIDIWGVQLEAGSVATPFTTASGTLQGELSLCQRYYWRNNGDTFSQLGAGTNASTTAAYIQVSAPVTMRTIPTAIDYANLSVYDSASYPGVSAISFLGNQSSPKTFGINCTSTSLTQFRPVFLICNNNINGYLGFSAEL